MSEEPWNKPGLRLTGFEALHRNWGWSLALGIALLVLGIIAISISMMTTLVSVVLIGWLLVIGGVILVIQGIWTRRWRGFFLNLTSGLLYIILGLMMLSHPLLGALSLTLLLAAYLIVSGLFRIVSASTHHFPHRGWLVLSGVIALVLGVLIWMQWPVSGLWVIGAFVGIDLLVSGWSYIMLATFAHRHLPPPQPA